MPSITVHRRLRPLRLVFLVRPSDRAALLRVFQTNTCLWGGRFNGIIPVFRRTPAWWDERPSLAPRAAEIVQGYLDAFEPDYVVTTHPELATGLDLEEGLLLQMEDVIAADRNDHVAYGFNVVELYGYLYEKEFQFVRRHPVEVIWPTVADPKLPLFKATCFGAFPEHEAFSYFERNYRYAFDPTDTPVDGTNLFEIMVDRKGTPLRMGAAELETSRGGRPSEPTLFYMDATKSVDLIDYWNLRALGWSILPVPSQWADALVEPCKQFVEKNHVPYLHNPQMMHWTTVLRSRSASEGEMLSFARQIDMPDAHALRADSHYPHIWNEWARKHDAGRRCEITAEESDVEGALTAEWITFPSLSPGFLEDPFVGGSKWANVIQIRDYRFDSETALVLPPGIRGLDKLLGTIESHITTSATSEGIVVRCQHTKWTYRWNLLDGLTAFRSWLAAQGFKAELSGPGRIASQLIRALEGLTGALWIADIEVLKLLDKMAHGLVESPTTEELSTTEKPKVRGRVASKKEWWDLLQKVNENNTSRARRHLEVLTERGVLRVGIRLKCPECSQTNWYPLGGIAERVHCERCLREFAFPTTDPPPDAWYYRTQGPFSVENYAQGGYAVAITLRFLTVSLHSEATWVPGLELTAKGSTPLEIDFALWRQRSLFGASEPTLLLGECKSFNLFEKRDFDRAKLLSSYFPGAMLVFATLRPELNPKEREQIAKLARSGRKRLKDDKWQTAVLVLTSHELTSDFGPPYCWEKAGDRFAEFAKTYRDHDELLGLCDATQQLHLGMESYYQWQLQDMEKRRQQRERRSARG